MRVNKLVAILGLSMCLAAIIYKQTVFYARLIDTIHLGEAYINISDNATFTQIASFFANGKIYLPIYKGVGHIYPPLTALFCIGVMEGFQISPTPFAARVILQITFLISMILLIFFTYNWFSDKKTSKILSFLILFVSLGFSLFIIQSKVSFDSVYTIHLLFLLLVLFINTFFLISKGKYAFLIPLFLTTTFMTSPTYVLTIIIGLFPIYKTLYTYLKQSTKFRISFAVGCLLSIMLMFGIYDKNAIDWTLIVPNLQEKAKFLSFFFSSQVFVSLLLITIFYTQVKTSFLCDEVKRFISFFIAGLYLSAYIPALKSGGGFYDFAPFLFFSTFFLQVLLFSKTIKRFSLFNSSLLALTVLVTFVYFGSKGGALPVLVEKSDQIQIQETHAILKILNQKNVKFYIDSAPAYYATNKIPFEYSAPHVWELNQANKDKAYMDLVGKIKAKYYDVLLLHLSPPGSDISERCLGKDLTNVVSSEYQPIMRISPNINPKDGIGDVYFNSTLVIFFRNNLPEDKAFLLKRDIESQLIDETHVLGAAEITRSMK